MKSARTTRLAATIALAALGLAAAHPAHAQTVTVASDSGDNYTLYGQFAGTNNGTGFGPWTVVGGDGAGASFINAQNNIPGPTTNQVFDLYNNGATLPSTATRMFNSPLATGGTFSTWFLDSYVPSSGNVGVILDDTSGNSLFTFYLTGNGATPAGGNPGNWRVTPGGIPASPLTAGADTGIPYAYYGALDVSVTLTDPSTISFTANEPANVGNNASSGGGSFTTTASLPAGEQIGGVTYFTANYGGGNDVEFNNLQIIAPAPEPSQNVALTLGAAALLGLALAAKRRRAHSAA